MKRIVTLTLLVLMGFACFVVYAQKEKAIPPKEMPKVDPVAELTKSIARGKAMFSDAKLGTNGMTCNSCHTMGGSMGGKMGDMTTMAFDALNTKFPKYWMMANRVVTLDQAVNYCIVGPLKGKALAWDSQELTDLVAYCASVTPMKHMPNAPGK